MDFHCISGRFLTSEGGLFPLPAGLAGWQGR